jgi:hypothetical protein
VEQHREVTDVSLPFVSFRYTYRFLTDGAVVTSDSILRFRSRDEVESSLVAHGYRVLDVREAPDRPGREFVFISEHDLNNGTVLDHPHIMHERVVDFVVAPARSWDPLRNCRPAPDLASAGLLALPTAPGTVPPVASSLATPLLGSHPHCGHFGSTATRIPGPPAFTRAVSGRYPGTAKALMILFALGSSGPPAGRGEPEMGANVISRLRTQRDVLRMFVQANELLSSWVSAGYVAV